MNKTMRVLLALLLLLSGCRHRLEVLNQSHYKVDNVSDLSQKGLVVSLSSNHQTGEVMRWLGIIAKDMEEIGGYKTSVVDIATDNTMLINDVHITIIFREITGDGSWGNFFVCWPGFLIFTHAWKGCSYDVHWGIESAIDFSGGLSYTDNQNFNLDVRYASSGTAMANNWGWAIYPLFTVTAIMKGYQTLSFDKQMIGELHSVFDETAAHYLAKKLVLLINRKMTEVTK